MLLIIQLIWVIYKIKYKINEVIWKLKDNSCWIEKLGHDW
jgi:hypothetical protein